MPGPVVYVPSRVGEGYFTDWQSPVAGDNGKVWAYNHGTGKFEPYTIPSTAPGGSTGYVQYRDSGGLFAGHSGFAYNGSGVATLSTALVSPAWRPASDSTTALQMQNAAGTAVVTVDTTNSRLGIGTASPGSVLHVSQSSPKLTISSTGTSFAYADFTTNSGSNYGRFGQESSASGGNLVSGSEASSFIVGSMGNTLHLISGGSIVQTLKSGNVGIGTTSPGQKLDVNGSVNVATALVSPAWRPASDSTTALQMQNAAGTAVVTVDTTNNGISVGSFIAIGSNPALSNAIRLPNNAAVTWRNGPNNGDVIGFSLNASSEFYCGNGALILFGAGGTPTMYITHNNGLVNIGNGTNFPSTTDGKLFVKGGSDIRQFVVRGHSTQTSNLVEYQNSGSTVQFAIGGDGKIKTNQAVTNTNTPSGATAKAMPIYNESGTLLGYIAIYASQW